MAQKRRGLGRGLEALIPDAQKEKVSAARPSDVFFPDSRETEAQEEDLTLNADSESVPEIVSEARSSRDLAATLLAPSQRKRGSKGRSARTVSSRSSSTSSNAPAKAKSTASVSRETTSGSDDSADDVNTKSERAASRATSKKRVQSAAKTTPKRSSKKKSSVQPTVTSKVEDLASQPEDLKKVSAVVEESSDSDATVIGDAIDRSVSEKDDRLRDSTVSRETAEETPKSAKDESARSEVKSSDETSVVAEVRSGAPNSIDADDDPTETDGGPELVPVPGAHFAEIPVGLIRPNPRQPRQVFDEEDISELAASIAEVGLLQPIVVRQVPNSSGEDPRYELIMGERRLRASKEAGLETIPAVVRDTDDIDLLRDALLENLHRVQLNPLEEAAAYQQLLEDFQCTHAELSERIARSRSQISNTLRLMKLPPLVQRRLAASVISAGHARALLGLPNAAEMERLAQRVVAEGLSVRATEELVALHEEAEPESGQPKVLRARSTPLPALSTRLSDAFDTRVKVTRGAKKGRITIEFAGEEDLARIVSALAPGTSLDEE